MGVVHHASYLSYFETGRVEFMRRRDVSYAAWVGRGVHLPVVDLGVRFRRPARFDQLLEVTTWIDKQSRFSVRFGYRIVEQGKLASDFLVEGHTRLACIDDQGALLPIPEAIAGRLAGQEMFNGPDGRS